ncbi:MAG: hypothetical protein Barrevirus3_24 [Barrevirus sp.]|uniref:Uncharacterized protein n=1 Tax=Barrevirus sp. TaxID=2487763 RepID=A0A3G4ZRE4_9VIRU|nr:MAG: hypothetical protein Barrevirus3_24 [Barrevirus sp.]
MSVPIWINGPYNLIRMEGKINNINKVLYFFMDKHMPPNLQSECPTLRNTHIRNYLIDQFDNLPENRTVDFFLETFPDMSGFVSKDSRSGIYLDQLRFMFERIFKFDFKKNKVIKSDEFNIRLHYMDIRPYFTFTVSNPFSLTHDISNYINDYPKKIILAKDVTMIRDGLDIFNSQLKIVYDALYPKKDGENSQYLGKVPIIRKVKNFINYDKDDASRAIKYLINKLKFVYKNKEVKDKINEIISGDLLHLFGEYTKISDQIYDLLNSNKDISVNDLLKLWGQQEDIIVFIFCLFVDMYFLRRVLDKDYVRTAITYTGGLHTANYVKYLVRKFDFHITHVYYSEIDNIGALERTIKDSKWSEPMDILSLLLPKDKDFYQCINVSNFPKNFS